MPTIAEVIKHLQGYQDQEAIVCCPIWQVDDALDRAWDGFSVTLTQEQAEAVIEAADDNHDACIGINWEVLDVYIENEIRNSKLGEAV